MKPLMRFVIKAGVFALPLFLVLSFPFYVMAKSGEFVSTDRILALHARKAPLYMICPAYSDWWSSVKLQSARKRKPEVLALGSSRIMQIRQEFFRRPFYNASKGISDITHFRDFIHLIPEDARPRVLLIALDPNLVNPGWVWSSSIPMHHRPPVWKQGLITFGKKWPQVYLDFLKGKFTLRDLGEKKGDIRTLGLTARVTNRGFINDGSFLYRDEALKKEAGLKTPPKEKFAEGLEAIRKGEDVFVPASNVSPERLQELEKFLKEAKEKNIHVVGYVPPYPPLVYRALQERKQDYAYLSEIGETAGAIFRKYGFSFFDFQDPGLLEASDDDFVDPEHDRGEVTLKLLAKMAKKDSLLESVIFFKK